MKKSVIVLALLTASCAGNSLSPSMNNVDFSKANNGRPGIATPDKPIDIGHVIDVPVVNELPIIEPELITPPETLTCPIDTVPVLRDIITCEAPIPTFTCPVGSHLELTDDVHCVIN